MKQLPTLPHRLDALDVERLQGFLHGSDGGVRVSGSDSVRLASKPAKPTEAATDRSDRIGLKSLLIAGAAALAAVLSQLPF